MNQALGIVQTPKNPGLVLASSSSWLMMNSFRNGMLVESMGRHKWLCYQRKLMTIFSPPPTIHLVVVTSLPFGFALMSRRGVNQTFFCENNQNSIKHLCASKTPNFYVLKRTKKVSKTNQLSWKYSIIFGCFVLISTANVIFMWKISFHLILTITSYLLLLLAQMSIPFLALWMKKKLALIFMTIVFFHYYLPIKQFFFTVVCYPNLFLTRYSLLYNNWKE